MERTMERRFFEVGFSPGFHQISQTLNGTGIIYVLIWLILMVNVGKYTLLH